MEPAQTKKGRQQSNTQPVCVSARNKNTKMPVLDRAGASLSRAHPMADIRLCSSRSGGRRLKFAGFRPSLVSSRPNSRVKSQSVAPTLARPNPSPERPSLGAKCARLRGPMPADLSPMDRLQDFREPTPSAPPDLNASHTDATKKAQQGAIGNARAREGAARALRRGSPARSPARLAEAGSKRRPAYNAGAALAPSNARHTKQQKRPARCPAGAMQCTAKSGVTGQRDSGGVNTEGARRSPRLLRRQGPGQSSNTEVSHVQCHEEAGSGGASLSLSWGGRPRASLKRPKPLPTTTARRDSRRSASSAARRSGPMRRSGGIASNSSAPMSPAATSARKAAQSARRRAAVSDRTCRGTQRGRGGG